MTEQEAPAGVGAIVVVRLRADGTRADDEVTAGLPGCVAALAARPGFVSADVGRNADEPDLLVLVSRWRDIGSYRRALGDYDVKLALMPVMRHALDEPSAYERLGPDR